MNPAKRLNVINYTTIVVSLLLWLAAIGMSYQDGRWLFSELVYQTGSLAWILLVVTVYLSLIQKILRRHAPKVKFFTMLLPARKYTGIFAFLVATSHGVLELIDSDSFASLMSFFTKVSSTNHMELIGALAWLVMLPIFMTSTTWAMKKMGPRAWKRLHRATHAVFILAGIHIAFISFTMSTEVNVVPLIILGIYLAGYAYLAMMKRLKKS